MPMASESNLVRKVANLLLNEGAEKSNLLLILDLILSQLDCSVGTIHTREPKSGMLVLLVHRGIPDVLLDKVKRIPIGKGMAGLAAERMKPVQVCNLQTDTTGAAKPAAKDTQMAGSIAAPMLVEKNILRGVLGVAKPVAYDFTEAEQELLLRLGTLIGKHLGKQTRQEVLDHYFLEARSKLVEVAAFLDRVDRADGDDDFRIKAFRGAVKELETSGERARHILMALSDPTTTPIPEAKGKSASGAWPGEQ
jgi:L-methionine (R)-S-oxide reductase